MESKTYIWLGIFIGGAIGAGLGSLLDHGNIFGLWGILLSGVGSIAGIYIAYKLSLS
jgi:hypothetical protein